MAIRVSTNLITRTDDYAVTDTSYISHTKTDSTTVRLNEILNDLYDKGSRFRTVINLPSSPILDEEILYVGESNDSLTKFSIYRYNGNSWDEVINLNTDLSEYPQRSEIKSVFDGFKLSKTSGNDTDDTDEYTLEIPQVVYSRDSDTTSKLTY